jgi:HK97 family phage portal protein
MSLLAKATKAIDQQIMASSPGSIYVPLADRQTWSDRLPTGPDAALNIATFYACVRVLAESVASLPLILYRRLPGGGKERATDHELYSVFHDQPNSAMTSFTWREVIMTHLATWGDSFHERVLNPFGRTQLWPIRPDRMNVRWDSTGTAKVYEYLSPTGQKQTLSADQVFHIPALTPNGLRGYSPVELHRKTLAIHNAARDFGESTFRNNARPAVVLSHPKNLSTGAIERLKGQMDELRGSKQAGKTVILEEDLKITPVGIPPKDAQYLESRVFEAREIQKIFRMPPHMVGDLERSTNNNIEQQALEFVNYTLRPWLVRIEQEIKVQLLDNSPDLFVEFLIDGLLRGDAEGRAKALWIQRQAGVINADDWNEIENRNPLPDGKGKAYWQPVNMTAATSEDAPAEPDIPNAPMQLSAVKSATLRCGTCNQLLAELATPPYRFTCRHCKQVTEAAA